MLSREMKPTEAKQSFKEIMRSGDEQQRQVHEQQLVTQNITATESKSISTSTSSSSSGSETPTTSTSTSTSTSTVTSTSTSTSPSTSEPVLDNVGLSPLEAYILTETQLIENGYPVKPLEGLVDPSTLSEDTGVSLVSIKEEEGGEEEAVLIGKRKRTEEKEIKEEEKEAKKGKTLDKGKDIVGDERQEEEEEEKEKVKEEQEEEEEMEEGEIRETPDEIAAAAFAKMWEGFITLPPKGSHPNPLRLIAIDCEMVLRKIIFIFIFIFISISERIFLVSDCSRGGADAMQCGGGRWPTVV